MKRFILLVQVLLVCFAAGAQSPEFKNYPLPSNPDTLRILAIGNSFSDDATQWLPDLLEAAGIHNVILGRLYIGGCTLERHCKEFETKGHEYVYMKSTRNKWETVKRYKEGCFMDGLGDEKWDIVTLQQGSPRSGQWNTYDPWLGNLIKIVRENCPNPECTIVWHQTWAYASDWTNKSFANYAYDQQLMYDSILACVRKLRKDYDIPTVIPSGVTVQILRGTKWNTAKDLTRDGFHMDYKYGRYATACTWFETLIKPTLGVSVKGNGCVLEGTGQDMTAKEARALQNAAVKACRFWQQGEN